MIRQSVRSKRRQFQLPVHEGEEFIPAREVEVENESAQVIEEVPPRAPCVSDGLNHGARQGQGRVKEEGQE